MPRLSARSRRQSWKTPRSKSLPRGNSSPARRRVAVHDLQRVMGVSERFAC